MFSPCLPWLGTDAAPICQSAGRNIVKPIQIVFCICLLAAALVIAIQRHGGQRASDPTEPSGGAPVTTTENRTAVAGDMDPQRGSRISIVPRRREAPGFMAMELQFGTEAPDPSWSGTAEARILGRVLQITGLELVSLTAECRATICRVQLLHPPGTRVRPSLNTLKAPANEIGLGHAAEVATLGDDGVPISVLYFQRKGA
jgi:hypothetical protein